MPKIKSSTTLRNEYTSISKECHETDEPIFITVNGEGDLAVMSIEAYERRERMLDIREKLLEAEIATANGSVNIPFERAMQELEDVAHGNL